MAKPSWGMRGERNQPHGRSAAAPVPTAVPPGGRMGEARRSIRSSALPSRWGAGTCPGSPAVRGGSPAAQRPCERGCTDRSAGGCADWPTFTTVHVRACGGLEAAEAQPRRREPWRSRGRRWSGLLGPLDRTTLPLCLLPRGVLAILSVLHSTRRPPLTRWVMAIERPLRRTSALSPQLCDASPPPALHRTPLRTGA